MRLKQLYFGFLMITFLSCANPTIAVKPDAEKFKKEFPNQIVKIMGVHRNIQYAWAGDPFKRPLIFVHGSPGSWEGWSHFLLNEKLKAEYHILVIDRPGYGGSSEGGTEPSLSKQADEVISLMKTNKSGLAAVLVGHSYGGPVIARAAIDHAEQVAGLVFVASSVSPELEETKWYQYVASWWPIKYLIPNSLRVCNEEIMALKAELQNMLPQWSKISSKVVIIQGMQDELVPHGNTDFLVAHLSPKIIVSSQKVPDLNHFVPWKRPELIEKGIENIRNVGNQ